jgi:hypothetical protein
MSCANQYTTEVSDPAFSLVQGESATFTFSFKDATGAVRSLAGASIWFACELPALSRKTVDVGGVAGQVVLSVTVGDALVNILAAETIALPVGTYEWQLFIQYPTLETEALVQAGRIVIRKSYRIL